MKLNNIIIISIFIIPLTILFYLNKTNQSFAKSDFTLNKPQIIKFSSSMCGECKRTEKELKPLFNKYKNDIIIENVQTDIRSNHNNNLMQKYKVNVVPTIVVLKKDKSIHKRIEGFCDYTTMETYIKDILK